MILPNGQFILLNDMATIAETRMVVAEWTGLEPATPGVTGRYSNQLNYHSAVKPAK